MNARGWASSMLFFFKKGDDLWCCVAVKKGRDEAVAEGEVAAVGVGDTQEQATDECCAMLRTRGHYDRPGDVAVWTAPH